jgi:hypothetical protein
MAVPGDADTPKGDDVRQYQGFTEGMLLRTTTAGLHAARRKLFRSPQRGHSPSRKREVVDDELATPVEQIVLRTLARPFAALSGSPAQDRHVRRNSHRVTFMFHQRRGHPDQ